MRATTVFTMVVLVTVLLWPSRLYVWLVVLLAIGAVTTFALWRMGS